MRLTWTVLCVAASCVLLSSCEPWALPAEYTNFVIRQGNFYCDGNSYPPWDSDTVAVRGVFQSDNEYTFSNGDQTDWNKLAGFFYPPFLGGIHQDSARLVWRYDPAAELFEVGYYCYVDGSRDGRSGVLGTVPPGVEYHAKILDLRDFYRFTFNYTVVVDVPKTRYETTRYFCKPYFGGTSPAPHTMAVRIAADSP